MRKFFLCLLALLALAAPAAFGQLLSSGILAPARDTDHTKDGVVGGIPSASWTQCGATLPASSSAATINAAVAACGPNQYVLIGPGTLSPSAALSITKSNVVIRGSGANSTFFVPANGASLHCADSSAFVCVSSSDGSYFNGYTAINWTAGYAQGTTQITLASVAGIVLNSTIITLNQCDDGKTGSYLSCAGTSVDNGNWFNCGDIYVVSPPSGCSVNGPDGGNVTTGRGQSEMFYATAISGNVVTLDHPLRNPNWTAARNPQAWLIQPVQYVGLEDMSIDVGNVSGISFAVAFNNAANVWTRGVRILHIPYSGVYHFDVIHSTDESDYIFQHNSFIGQADDDFGFNFTQADSYLVQNNICQQIKSCFFDEGNSNGGTVAYNVRLRATPEANNFMWAAAEPHAIGNNYRLYEGNVVNSFQMEDIHGTGNAMTYYRNLSQGWYSDTANPKNLETNCFEIEAFHRYMNLVANACGTPGVHTVYKVVAAPGEFSSPQTELSLGQGNNSVTNVVPGDPLSNCAAADTSLCWSNYDTVNNSVQCNTAEVPTGAPLLPNPVPTKGCGGAAMPPSFYLTSRPSWYSPSIVWPAVHPESAGGNVGICNGTPGVTSQAGMAALSSGQCPGGFTASAWAGHVDAIPAFLCYLNVMGGAPDGSGSTALPFDRNTCYASTQTAAPAIAPATGSYVSPQTVTITDATGGAVICYTIDGSTPTANGAGTCTHGTTYTAPFSQAVPATVKAIGSTAGLADSSVTTNTYTLITQTATPAIAPASGAYSSPQGITITDSTPGATICYTVDGSTPTANGAGTCTHGTTYTGGFSQALPATVKAIGSASGFTDSAVATNTYTVPSQVVTPSIMPAAGAYPTPQTITITTATGGATICYTTDGSTPTTNGAGTCTHGTTYTVAFSQAIPSTVEAIGSKSGSSDSAVATNVYTLESQAFRPAITPASGAYTSPQTITLSSATVGATICYTTDGSTPTGNGAGTCVSGTTYTVPFSQSIPATVSAMATAAGFIDSVATVNTYTLIPTQTATPLIAPAAGNYFSPQTITLSDSTGGATICYTADGSTPTANGAGTCTHGATYTVPFSQALPATVKAIGSTSGFTDSGVASSTFTSSEASAPVILPAAGAYATPQTITITTPTMGATICYTVDGSTPTANGAGTCTHGTTYTVPFSQAIPSTVKAIASLASLLDSAVTSNTYTQASSATPAILPPAGTYTTPQTVSISTATAGATICYTVDGSTPTANGAGTCTHGSTYTGGFSQSIPATVKAIASLAGLLDSAAASNAYALQPTVATPAIAPASGAYTTPQTITITDATGGASIFYTTTGATPTCSSTLYTAPFSQAIGAGGVTVKAIGCLSGSTNSAVASNSYTLSNQPPPSPAVEFVTTQGPHSGCQPVAAGDTYCCLALDGLFLSVNGAPYQAVVLTVNGVAPSAAGAIVVGAKSTTTVKPSIFSAATTTTITAAP